MGFSFVKPIVKTFNDKANISFEWRNDPKITTENFAEYFKFYVLNNIRRYIIVEIPENVSLKIDGEYPEDLYANVQLNYTGFANFDDFQQNQEEILEEIEKNDALNQYLSEVNEYFYEIENISDEIESILSMKNNNEDFENFEKEITDKYSYIKNLRQKMAQNTYEFIVENNQNSKPSEEINAEYNEISKLISELSNLEKKHTLIFAEFNLVQQEYENNDIDADEYHQIYNELIAELSTLSTRIADMKQDFYNYCHNVNFQENSPQIPTDTETPNFS